MGTGTQPQQHQGKISTDHRKPPVFSDKIKQENRNDSGGTVIALKDFSCQGKYDDGNQDPWCIILTPVHDHHGDKAQRKGKKHILGRPVHDGLYRMMMYDIPEGTFQSQIKWYLREDGKKSKAGQIPVLITAVEETFHQGKTKDREGNPPHAAHRQIDRIRQLGPKDNCSVINDHGQQGNIF